MTEVFKHYEKLQARKSIEKLEIVVVLKRKKLECEVC